MTFVDSGTFSDPFGGGLSVGGSAPGGELGGPGFGGGMSKLTGQDAPGTLSSFDRAAVGSAGGTSGRAMANRYAQLGLGATGATPGGKKTPGTPGSPAGGIGVANIGNPNAALTPPLPTAEAMDLGTGFPGGLPSLGGGVTGEAQATLGQIQNDALQMMGGGGGSGGGGKGGGGGGKGGMTSMLPMLAGGK
jgi:hypothetical protein